ncbi:uncharacterized protein K460DRAFT_370681 [Cucurbitaria berberidis CBS 394.84]|uniref:F-box domain-containing protein n=1 Tax=Cucurbitaria berberidis CBS 394.84 TaxID=1168544 RepID=A0A9P4G882_9PLEO|nr:uncharacterized protein K460DRAFT_370681 [Cucurbitaria berberidis CBS 394.84]KAF1840716.1 hypothetical protein K460DRAFT_370681 [Cucurbitaria berberidis CBS 394.84]
MAVLTDLPAELLEQIYHFLGSIDDVHCFGRACKTTYHNIKRQNVYVEIMRSVVQHSPQHRYDYQLCRMLNLHTRIVHHFEQNGGHLPVTRTNALGYTLNEWENALALASVPITCESSLCSECLPDEMVYEILARYQGLRTLEDIWLERQLNESDFLAVDGTSDADQIMQSFHTLVGRAEEFRDGDISARNSKTPETKSYTTFNADQRARFYSAVVCVWLLNEIRWVLTNFAYPGGFNIPIMVLEGCRENIAKQKSTCLLDELDQHAIFTFMYHHLLPSYGTFLADRDSSKLPFTFCSDFMKDSPHCIRLLQLFLAAGQTYLQPPDLIDLIVRSKVSRRAPYPLMTLPVSTENWIRPSRAFALPHHFGLCDNRYKSLIQRASLIHLSLIIRSSFHQTQDDMSQNRLTAPALSQAPYDLKDHARQYFTERAMVAFELYEQRSSGLRNIRDGFWKVWDRVLWSVWWWANSEEKARAKMERWRQRRQWVGGRIPRA